MKKILSVLLAMVMIFSVMSAGITNASAASVFSGAKKISALDVVSAEGKKGLDYYYKISLTDSGKITFHCSKYSNWGEKLSLLNSNGKTIISADDFSKRLEKEYNIEKKGTYYIRIQFTSSIPSWDSFTNFYYTFEPDAKPTISIGVYMDVGDTLNVAALASNYDGKVTWKTTKKAVATISKGKIKAKSAGKARIRAYMDNGEYAEIVVIVKDED